VVALAAMVAVGGLATACAPAEEAGPRCRPDQRLGLVAQSLPSASYVPCLGELPAGWTLRSFDFDHRGTSFSLASDRADEPIEVVLVESCDTTGAVPVRPRAEGVRSSQRLTGIAPAYAGERFDVFPGGCVSYRFRFERGPHISLMDELDRAVELYSRRQLRQDLRADLDLELDP
jgi:hypothetical protein